MKGYWTGASYVGFMPDGKRRYFVSDMEYKEAYEEELRMRNTDSNEKKDD